MKRKGFTLIELLAVIVILAVIALITTTVIIKVVENSRKNAAKNSALNYLDAVEKYVMYHDVDSEKYPYDLKDNTWNIVDTTKKEISLLNIIPSVKAEEVEVPPLNDFIKVNGSKPTSGTVTIDNKGKITNAVMVVLNYNITCDSSIICSVEGKSLNEKETKITNIELSEDTTIEEGDSHTFTATIEPNDADTNTITWCSSSDTVISEATEQGRCETGEYEITTCYGNMSCEITGTNEGETIIMARINDVSGSASLIVNKSIPSSAIYWNGNTFGRTINDFTYYGGTMTDYEGYFETSVIASDRSQAIKRISSLNLDISNYSYLCVEYETIGNICSSDNLHYGGNDCVEAFLIKVAGENRYYYGFLPSMPLKGVYKIPFSEFYFDGGSKQALSKGTITEFEVGDYTWNLPKTVRYYKVWFE